jgi:hypothetical protein
MSKYAAISKSKANKILNDIEKVIEGLEGEEAEEVAQNCRDIRAMSENRVGMLSIAYMALTLGMETKDGNI